MPMTIWTTWLPEPPRMPATSVASPMVATSDARYMSHSTWRGDVSLSPSACDESLAVEQRRDDAKQNDVGHEQHQRKHHRKGDARSEHIEGHQSHDRKRWKARERPQLLSNPHVARARRNADAYPDRPSRQERREQNLSQDVRTLPEGRDDL